MPTPVLDWRSRHDPRSLAFPARAVVSADAYAHPPRKVWRRGRILNQGSEGACVGHAWVGEAMASPERERFADAQQAAFDVYHAAQRIDEYEGEDYSGTSVLAGAKIMAKRGMLAEYRWAFNVGDVVAAIVEHGPVVLGIPWHAGMYAAPGGVLRITGDVVGGHAILATGYDPERVVDGWPRPAVRLTNSWGLSWGRWGSAWITESDLSALLAQQGEACVPVVRRVR